jgi:hypothetical protein
LWVLGERHIFELKRAKSFVGEREAAAEIAVHRPKQHVQYR